MAGIKELTEKLMSDDTLAKLITEAGNKDAVMEKIKELGFEVSPDELTGIIASVKAGKFGADELGKLADKAGVAASLGKLFGK